MTDPTLTERARAVLATLTKHQRDRLTSIVAAKGISACRGFVCARVTNHLAVKGVVWVWAAASGERFAEPTDLGREVARLLAEGAIATQETAP